MIDKVGGRGVHTAYAIHYNLHHLTHVNREKDRERETESHRKRERDKEIERERKRDREIEREKERNRRGGGRKRDVEGEREREIQRQRVMPPVRKSLGFHCTLHSCCDCCFNGSLISQNCCCCHVAGVLARRHFRLEHCVFFVHLLLDRVPLCVFQSLPTFSASLCSHLAMSKQLYVSLLILVPHNILCDNYLFSRCLFLSCSMHASL